jgi:response regulator NasT
MYEPMTEIDFWSGADEGSVAVDVRAPAVAARTGQSAPSRVLVAERDPVLAADLEEILTEAGFSIAGQARDGAAAVALAAELQPDLVVLDVAVPGVRGLTAAGPISDQHIPVILLMAPSEGGLVHEAVAAGAMAWLVKPVVPPSLVATAHMVLARQAEKDALRESVERVRGRIEEHKLIERAKGLLMTRHTVPESVAADWMRQTAEDTGTSLARVAEAIVAEWPAPAVAAPAARSGGGERPATASSDWLPLAEASGPPNGVHGAGAGRPRRRKSRGGFHHG